MGKMQLLLDREFIAAADRHRRSCPLPHPVDREHDRLFERRGKERAGRVAEMVLGEQQPFPDPSVGSCPPELIDQHFLLEQPLLEPEWHRFAERQEAARCERQIGLEQALELEKGFFVEDDVIDILQADLALVQTRPNRLMRERGIVLYTGEALLLRRRDDIAADDQRSRAVMIEGGDAKYPQDDLRTACRRTARKRIRP